MLLAQIITLTPDFKLIANKLIVNYVNNNVQTMLLIAAQLPLDLRNVKLVLLKLPLYQCYMPHLIFLEMPDLYSSSYIITGMTIFCFTVPWTLF